MNNHNLSQAMILAAGLGTRLRPLTNTKPKALVEVDGRPLLEHAARRLIAAGATSIIINLHHHAEQIRAFVASQEDFGVDVHFSEEKDEVLGTGGGLKHAAGHVRKDAPLVVHNSDILSTVDLRSLFEHHLSSGALATLAVMPAETQRYLVFDASDRLCGYGHPEEERQVLVREPVEPARRVDFCGIQVVSPRIFELMHESGVFSIINTYLRLSKAGERIAAHAIGEAKWLDAGTHERLEKARDMYNDR